MPEHHATHPVLFFDGFCGLCDRVVAWLEAHDHGQQIRYAPLQGATARNQQLPANSETAILIDARGVHYRSAAVLRAVAHLGGIWTLALSLLLIPRFIREPIYNLVSRNRNKWFGRLDSCRLPSLEKAHLFLP